MRQLSGLDSAFLNLENATQFGHVSGLSIFTRPDTPGYEPYGAWKQQLEQRLHLLEPLRRRLAEVLLASITRSGSTIRTLSCSFTCATRRYRRRVATNSWRMSSDASLPDPLIGADRCGCPM